ncbi:MAG TPA: ABC transporter permease [Bradyrhizobium sp.]|nr:ABC transporter permease [Bradyrhizobium sp.]
MNANEADDWTTVIDASDGRYLPDLRGVWRYRDLVMLFVRRDTVANYKQSLLGPLWFVAQPLMTTVVFAIVFGGVLSIPTDGLSPFLFYFAGTLCWQYFATNLTRTSDTLTVNAGLYSKVYFPRLVTPVSVVIGNLIIFGVQFAVFVAVLCLFIIRGAPVRPDMAVVLLPLLLLQIAACGLGAGLIISTLTTRYRDLNYMLGYLMQLWMYATPIVYPLSQVSEKWLWLLYLNPMTAVVQMFRHLLLGSAAPSMGMMSYSIAVSVLVISVGLALFTKVERTFMDIV